MSGVLQPATCGPHSAAVYRDSGGSPWESKLWLASVASLLRPLGDETEVHLADEGDELRIEDVVVAAHDVAGGRDHPERILLGHLLRRGLEAHAAAQIFPSLEALVPDHPHQRDLCGHVLPQLVG